MSDSIQIETINSYTKNTTKEIGNFPIATGAITNCPVPVNSVSSVSVFSSPPLILEPLNVPPIIPTPQIFGCTDPNAINYNPIATANDGSCVYPVLGCTDPNAFNYNPSANINDGSCIYPFCVVFSFLSASNFDNSYQDQYTFTIGGLSTSATLYSYNFSFITKLPSANNFSISVNSSFYVSGYGIENYIFPLVAINPVTKDYTIYELAGDSPTLPIASILFFNSLSSTAYIAFQPIDINGNTGSAVLQTISSNDFGLIISSLGENTHTAIIQGYNSPPQPPYINKPNATFSTVLGFESSQKLFFIYPSSLSFSGWGYKINSGNFITDRCNTVINVG